MYRLGQINNYSKFLQLCENDNMGSKFELSASNQVELTPHFIHLVSFSKFHQEFLSFLGIPR